MAQGTTYRFISDGGHGWAEIPLVDLDAVINGTHLLGIIPSKYSYVDTGPTGGGVAYLEEDCDLARYLDAAGGIKPTWEDVHIPGDCWVRDLPRCGPGCSWCGRTTCPDRHRTEGCWYPNCPDDPHGI